MTWNGVKEVTPGGRSEGRGGIGTSGPVTVAAAVGWGPIPRDLAEASVHDTPQSSAIHPPAGTFIHQLPPPHVYFELTEQF